MKWRVTRNKRDGYKVQYKLGELWYTLTDHDKNGKPYARQFATSQKAEEFARLTYGEKQ